MVRKRCVLMLGLCVLGAGIVSSLVLPEPILAACTVEASSPDKSGPLMKHVSADCTAAEREAQAVPAEAILQAMTAGQAVDLVGVVVKGDLILDQLPVHQAQVPKGLTPEQQAALASLNEGERRIVSGAVILRDSIVKGAIRHQSPSGTLQFQGAVDLQGSRFEKGFDLSRSVFQGPVTLTKAVFAQEAYFVKGEFAQPVGCVETKFGPHTRFHRTVFHGAVDCQGSFFDGMAELLEVIFEQPANFERVRFGSGTGFSGAQFKKKANFSEAIFSRETFFAFTVFGDVAQFAGAQFLQTADFSNAEFQQGEDLAKVRFDRPPAMERVKGATFTGQPATSLASTMQYLLTLSLLLIAVLLVAYAYKLK